MAAQTGNKTGANQRLARQALEAVLKKRGGSRVDGYIALQAIWDKLVDEAIDGDKQAAGMIFDRIEGKPQVVIAGAGEDGEHVVNSSIQVTFVRPNRVSGDP